MDTVVGLDAGADDYVTKALPLAELLARVRALLRRGSAEAQQPPATHGVRIDVESHRAWMGDEELQLTAKEFDLLRVLVRDAGRVVTRDQLMREVWDTTWWSSTKTLDMHISWLRKKLGDDAANPRYIATVRGVGFRFEKSWSPGPQRSPQVTDHAPPSHPVHPRRRPRGDRRLGVPLVIVETRTISETPRSGWSRRAVRLASIVDSRILASENVNADVLRNPVSKDQYAVIRMPGKPPIEIGSKPEGDTIQYTQRGERARRSPCRSPAPR